MEEGVAKWVLLAYGLFMTTLVAGVVYGWQSFRAVFIAEGVLSEGCDANSADGECPSQAKELGLIFACGAWSVQACRMVTGLVRDRYGTRVCVVGVMLTVAVGIVLECRDRDVVDREGVPHELVDGVVDEDHLDRLAGKGRDVELVTLQGAHPVGQREAEVQYGVGGAAVGRDPDLLRVEIAELEAPAGLVDGKGFEDLSGRRCERGIRDRCT